MSNLKEIVLTPDKGFVIEGTQEPVEIISGIPNCEVESERGDAIICGVAFAEIENAITKEYAPRLPKEGISGYILQWSDMRRTASIIEHKLINRFSAVKYKKKSSE